MGDADTIRRLGPSGACAIIAIARGRHRAPALLIAQRLKRSRYSTISAGPKMCHERNPAQEIAITAS
jgi:hypothetical protein